MPMGSEAMGPQLLLLQGPDSVPRWEGSVWVRAGQSGAQVPNIRTCHPPLVAHPKVPFSPLKSGKGVGIEQTHLPHRCES